MSNLRLSDLNKAVSQEQMFTEEQRERFKEVVNVKDVDCSSLD